MKEKKNDQHSFFVLLDKFNYNKIILIISNLMNTVEQYIEKARLASEALIQADMDNKNIHDKATYYKKLYDSILNTIHAIHSRFIGLNGQLEFDKDYDEYGDELYPDDVYDFDEKDIKQEILSKLQVIGTAFIQFLTICGDQKSFQKFSEEIAVYIDAEDYGIEIGGFSEVVVLIASLKKHLLDKKSEFLGLVEKSEEYEVEMFKVIGLAAFLLTEGYAYIADGNIDWFDDIGDPIINNLSNKNYSL